MPEQTFLTFLTFLAAQVTISQNKLRKLGKFAPAPMRALVNMVLIAAGAYAILTAYLFLFQSRFIFFPDTPSRDLTADPRAIGLDFEDVRFAAADGTKLHGWWIPASPSRGLLLFLHGNAGNISHRLDSIRLFHELGLSVFIFDYRGYGLSDGKPTESGTYQDALAAWEYALNEKDLAPDRVVIFGRSLGGTIGAWLADQRNPGALIIESTFTSVPDMARQIYPFLPTRWLTRLHYDARQYLAGVSCPVLVIHSREDELIPFEHGQTLYEAVRAPRAFLEIRGGHNNGPFLTGPSYTNGLEDFLAEHFPEKGEPQ